MPALAVIQLSRLGDLHQTLPVLQGLQAKYPLSDIILVCCDDFAEALPENSFKGEKVALPRASLGRWVQKMRACDKGEVQWEDAHAELPQPLLRHFDLVVNLTHDELSSALMGLMESENKSGRVNSPSGEIRLTGDWSKYLFSAVQNRLDNLFNLVDIFLGIAGIEPKPGPPALLPDGEQGERGLRLLIEAGWDQQGECLALQLGASNAFRALGPRKFAEAMVELHQIKPRTILLLGTVSELPLFAAFSRFFPYPCLNLMGKTSMADLPWVLARCRLLISNDTGTLHAAASVGTPVLGLFFATAYYSETAPYGAGHTVMQAALPCSPCSGDRPCQVQHCRQAFSPSAIAQIAKWILDGRVGPAPGPFPSLELYVSDFAGDGTLLYAPARGWPVSSRYRQAMAWRQVFARLLGLAPRENAWPPSARFPYALPQSAVAALSHLALSLEQVSARLMDLEDRGARHAAKSASMQSAQAATRAAMEQLIHAQQQCGAWGHFIRFDLLGTESGEELGLSQLRRRHLRLAAKTRDMLLSPDP